MKWVKPKWINAGSQKKMAGYSSSTKAPFAAFGSPPKPPKVKRLVACGDWGPNEALLWSKLPSQKIANAVVKTTNQLVLAVNDHLTVKKPELLCTDALIHKAPTRVPSNFGPGIKMSQKDVYNPTLKPPAPTRIFERPARPFDHHDLMQGDIFENVEPVPNPIPLPPVIGNNLFDDVHARAASMRDSFPVERFNWFSGPVTEVFNSVPWLSFLPMCFGVVGVCFTCLLLGEEEIDDVFLGLGNITNALEKNMRNDESKT